MSSIVTNTLFYDAATGGAVLVTGRAGRRTKKAKRFNDPHAALDWCIARCIGFVFMPGALEKN